MGINGEQKPPAAAGRLRPDPEEELNSPFLPVCQTQRTPPKAVLLQGTSALYPRCVF